MSLLGRFRQWRQDRLIRGVVYSSGEAMLVLAAERLGREIDENEQAILMASYGKWLVADESRCLGLITQPTRTLHLFLSEVI